MKRHEFAVGGPVSAQKRLQRIGTFGGAQAVTFALKLTNSNAYG